MSGSVAGAPLGAVADGSVTGVPLGVMTVGCVAEDALLVADCTAVPVGCSLCGSVFAEPVDSVDDVSLDTVVLAPIGPFCEGALGNLASNNAGL